FGLTKSRPATASPAPRIVSSGVLTPALPGHANAATQAASRSIPSALIVPLATSAPDGVGGSVRSASGQPLPALRVTLVAGDGTVVKSTTTGADGRFNFDGIKAGTYKVSVADPDFLYTTAHEAKVTVESGKAAPVEIVMERGPARIAGTIVDALQKP